MANKRIIYEDEMDIVKKGDNEEDMTPEEIKIYLQQFIRNKDFYIDKYISNFDFGNKIIFSLRLVLMVILTIISMGLSFSNAFDFLPYSFFSLIALGSAGVLLTGKFDKWNIEDANSMYDEQIKMMEEILEKASILDKESLECEEQVDFFIKDIKELITLASDVSYNGYLDDCAILYQLGVNYLETKKKFETSQSDVLYRNPDFYKIYAKMVFKIKDAIRVHQNEQVNIEAIRQSLSSLFSEDMLSDADKVIEEMKQNEEIKLELKL